MPSLMARLIGAVLRTTGTYRNRYSDGPGFEARIAASRANPDLPTSAIKKKLAVNHRQFEGRSVWHLAPKDRAPTAHILYFHGGGYVYPAVEVHWKFYAHLAEKYGLAITAPMYPLAPEAGVEETTAWAMAAYHDFVNQHPGRFILGGDNAGGGLASGLRQADGLLLICPWVDASISHPDQVRIEARDCILTIDGARMAGQLYARNVPVSDPWLSPIFGSWTDLPPTLVFGGGDDILLPDARAVAAKIPIADYVEGEGLMHDWPIFFLPESRKAQARIAEFAVTHAGE
jgi:epsilon-lactone hydrolase